MAFEDLSATSVKTEQWERTPDNKRVYDTETGSVEVSWKVFYPSEKNAEKKKELLAKVILFLPGWAITSKSESIKVILVHGEKDPISDYKKIAPVERPSRREEFLKINLFKNSPYVKMVVGEKAGHYGLSLFRPESASRTSLYMLEHFYRKEKTDQ